MREREKKNENNSKLVRLMSKIHENRNEAAPTPSITPPPPPRGWGACNNVCCAYCSIRTSMSKDESFIGLCLH